MLISLGSLMIISMLFWLPGDTGGKLSDFGLNLFSSAVMAFFTVTLLEKMLKKQRELESIPFRVTAYLEIRNFTSNITNLWRQMYFESHIISDINQDLSPDFIFEERTINSVRDFLDLNKCPNIIFEKDWFSYLIKTNFELVSKGNVILTRYAGTLDVKIYRAIYHTINESALLAYMDKIPTIRQLSGKSALSVLASYLHPPKPNDIEQILTICSWLDSEYHFLKTNNNENIPELNDYVPFNNNFAGKCKMQEKERKQQVMLGAKVTTWCGIDKNGVKPIKSTSEKNGEV